MMHMKSMWTVAVSMFVVVHMIGCGVDEEVATTQQAAGPPVPPPIECPPNGCFNSPTIELEPYGQHEFSLLGEPNLQHTSIPSVNGRAQIMKHGVSYDLYIEKGRIHGKHSLLPTLKGQDLVGAEILFLPENAEPFMMQIYGVRTDSFALGAHDEFEAYKLTWHYLGKPAFPDLQRVCHDPNQIQSGEYHVLQYLGLEDGESVVFEGDRFDSESKTVDPDLYPDWFNVGCAGTVLAKLYMLRQTSHRQSTAPAAPHEQRQATLKMLTAAYCDGTSFTVTGEPLLWQGGLFQFPPSLVDEKKPLELEARWTETGAQCLGAPRLLETAAQHSFGDIRHAVAAQCPDVPACTNTDAWDYDKALLITANPPPASSP
jgi:ADYC domain